MNAGLPRWLDDVLTQRPVNSPRHVHEVLPPTYARYLRLPMNFEWYGPEGLSVHDAALGELDWLSVCRYLHIDPHVGLAHPREVEEFLRGRIEHAALPLGELQRTLVHRLLDATLQSNLSTQVFAAYTFTVDFYGVAPFVLVGHLWEIDRLKEMGRVRAPMNPFGPDYLVGASEEWALYTDRDGYCSHLGCSDDLADRLAASMVTNDVAIDSELW